MDARNTARIIIKDKPTLAEAHAYAKRIASAGGPDAAEYAEAAEIIGEKIISAKNFALFQKAVDAFTK